MSQLEYVICVDENDTPLGQEEKLRAHQKGLLHRAFSGFVFNDKKELLIQQRSAQKYHNPGIWSNTVCSHPRPGEETLNAVNRRLKEEFGFTADFQEIGHLLYHQTFPNGLTEYEFDHIFIAPYNGDPIRPDLDEIQDWRWIGKGDLQQEIKKSPDSFSFWLREILRNDLLKNYDSSCSNKGGETSTPSTSVTG